ncbi:uncharacterized protein CDAR_499821 [Caerostris darwini]|uniref:Uncharacterized protein n=1 Tax=Caerostris darwini TaxID=1538125 RepID=A0AAV4X1Q0_9ARAC|nr:uncharacterized protein CDAR_499821 [Caerostris darwini]
MDCDLFREEICSFDCSSKLSTSIPNGLHEEFRFLPNAPFQIRRTSSLGDISRFYRYFHLIQTNNGMLFTWRHYLKILQDQLRSFETLTILNKAMISLISVEKSDYFTPDSDSSSTEDAYATHMENFTFDEVKHIHLSADDASSVMTDYSSITPNRRAQILKKICVEMKHLAHNIHKFVEVIARLPEKCTECGVRMDVQKYKKQCQEIIRGVGDVAEAAEEHLANDQKEKTKTTSFLSVSSVLSLISRKGGGELRSKVKLGKKSGPKKGSFKQFASMCTKYVKRG